MIGEEYTSIYSKVKSWIPVLLKENELEDLSRMPLNEYLAYLKKRTKKIDIQSDETVQIEGLLKQESFFFIKSGLRFLSGTTKDFIEEWSKIYEIDNLKILTRAIINQKPVGFLYQLGEFSKIQIEMVKDLKTLEELQEFLGGTDYYRLAQDSLPRVKEENNAFYFEMNLDNYYALNLKKQYSHLSLKDKKVAQELIFFFLEINRILWIYRSRFNYGMQTEQVISLIPNILNVLSRKRYEKLIESEKADDFVANLKTFKFVQRDYSEDYLLEKEMYKNLSDKARGYLRGTPFSLAVFLGFIILHFLSVRNLIMLLESKKLNVSIEKIKDLLAF